MSLNQGEQLGLKFRNQHSTNCKFKIVLGNDIRRLKNPVSDINQLRQSIQKSYGDGLNTDEQKYYYYDSDDDRVDISDDEDLEEAVGRCKKKILKIYVENYDIRYDPFFQSISLPRSDKNTGPSTESQNIEAKMSELISSGKSYNESMASSVEHPQQNNFEEYKRAFDSIQDTIS